MAEYILRAEVTVSGGFGEGIDPREYLGNAIQSALENWPSKSVIKVATIGTSGKVPYDPDNWLEINGTKD